MHSFSILVDGWQEWHNRGIIDEEEAAQFINHHCVYVYFYDYFRFYLVTDKRYKRSKANREYQASTEHGSTSANRNLISVPPATVITLQIMLSFSSQSCAILQVRIYPSFQFFIVYCFRKVKNNLSCCADMGRWTVWSSISTGTARWWPGELWLVDTGSRDRNAHLWLVRQVPRVLHLLQHQRDADRGARAAQLLRGGGDDGAVGAARGQVPGRLWVGPGELSETTQVTGVRKAILYNIPTLLVSQSHEQKCQLGSYFPPTWISCSIAS